MIHLSLVLLLPLATFAFRAQAAELRSDLSKHSAYFCDESPKPLKDKALPDAQIELAFVKSDRDLKIVAEEFAEDNQHRGYSHGQCPNGKRYVVSTPAPASFLTLSAHDVRIDQAALRICREYSVDVIKSDDERPLTLPRGTTKVSLRNLAALSITCLPKDKAKAGPELWALLTFHPAKVPVLKTMPEFFVWLKDTRSRLKLPPLQGNEILNRTAGELGTDSLSHPHAQLLTKKSRLEGDAITLIGENRAVAEDFTGLALLLWNSPQHRALLLNAKANAIGYALKDTPDEKRLVLLLAQI